MLFLVAVQIAINWFQDVQVLTIYYFRISFICMHIINKYEFHVQLKNMSIVDKHKPSIQIGVPIELELSTKSYQTDSY